MSLTINLPAEAEARLAEQAKAIGRSHRLPLRSVTRWERLRFAASLPPGNLR